MMSKDQAIGGAILAVCVIVVLCFIVLVAFPGSSCFVARAEGFR